MGRKSIREETLESGMKTLHERGFATAGVREITAAAGVPQGSFINHFGSKEAFGVLVLERYAANTLELMNSTLRDESLKPTARLRAYFEAVAVMLREADWRYGCLIGNMSLEAAEHSDAMRTQLVSISRSMTERFAEVVRAGQAAGEFRNDLDAGQLAGFLFSAWQGAMLRMKVERTGKAIDAFIDVVFTALFAKPAKARR